MTSRPSKPSSKTKRAASAGSGAVAELRFDAATLRHARELAAGYTILVEPNPTEAGAGWYIGRSIEVPTAFANARSPGEAFDAVRECLVTIVAAMIQEGVEPPASSSASTRQHQMNIRLSTLERTRLAAAARQAGFRSISDFVRTAALKQAG